MNSEVKMYRLALTLPAIRANLFQVNCTSEFLQYPVLIPNAILADQILLLRNKIWHLSAVQVHNLLPELLRSHLKPEVSWPDRVCHAILQRYHCFKNLLNFFPETLWCLPLRRRLSLLCSEIGLPSHHLMLRVTLQHQILLPSFLVKGHWDRLENSGRHSQFYLRP